jgi:protein SCO1
VNALQVATLALAGLCVVTGPRAADPQAWAAVPPPAGLLERVGIEQRLGASVPLDLAFRDARGRTIRLREAVDAKPTLLVPGYYHCTNLCDVVRAGVAQAISAVSAGGLNPSEQFNVVLISIDPRESPADAAAAQRRDALAHPGAQVLRWHYLVGTAAASTAFARAIGFHFLFDPRNGQYAHNAGVVVVSPQGTVTQYLLGVQFASLSLRLALVSASRGHLGTLVDRLVLMCCDYDSSSGRYSLMIARVLQGLGVLTLLALGGLILTLRVVETRARAARMQP